MRKSTKRLLCFLLVFSLLHPPGATAEGIDADLPGPVLFSLFKKKGPKIDIEAALVLNSQTTPEEMAKIPGADVNAPGINVAESEEAAVDYSNISNGYIMVRYNQPTDSRIKAQIESADVKYTYTMNPCEWTAFPLSEGSGEYTVNVLRDIGNSRYAMVLSTQVHADISDEFAPFLRSNQYVDYADAPNAIATAANLVSESGEPLETVRNIYGFVTAYLTYDYALAESVTSGYVPDIDAVLAKKSGICFDYASLMTGMLRSLRIPCKLVVGYADELYHAWISVWLEGEGWVDNVIHFDGKEWEFMDPTFASAGYKGETAYAAKYFY